jgi:excisionase family DNA binding protein
MQATLPPPVDDPLPRYITVPQFCERFQLSRSKAYELLQSGRIRSVRIDGARRIPIKAVLEFAEGLITGELTE